MIAKHDAERIAAGIHGFRPDWPVQQLMTLAYELQHWPVLDLAVGLMYVAADPATKSPYRVKEQGPWRTIGSTDPEAEKRKQRDERNRRSRMAGLEEARRDREACHVCDETGRLPSGLMCPHTDQAAINRRGAERARLALQALNTPTVTEETS